MNIRAQPSPEQQMTIEEFLAFTASRPDEERWELIEGTPVLNPSPIGVHQLVAGNIVAFLLNAKRERNAPWTPLLGIGTRVPISPMSLPQPDVYVQKGPVGESHVTDDAIAVFEVLSRSNTKSDQAWRRRVYASVPNCEHYVTVSLKRFEATVFSRAQGWDGSRFRGKAAVLPLPALDLMLPLDDVYRWTSVDAS